MARLAGQQSELVSQWAVMLFLSVPLAELLQLVESQSHSNLQRLVLEVASYQRALHQMNRVLPGQFLLLLDLDPVLLVHHRLQSHHRSLYHQPEGFLHPVHHHQLFH